MSLKWYTVPSSRNQFENETKLQIPVTCLAMDQAVQVLVTLTNYTNVSETGSSRLYMLDRINPVFRRSANLEVIQNSAAVYILLVE